MCGLGCEERVALNIDNRVCYPTCSFGVVSLFCNNVCVLNLRWVSVYMIFLVFGHKCGSVGVYQYIRGDPVCQTSEVYT